MTRASGVESHARPYPASFHAQPSVARVERTCYIVRRSRRGGRRHKSAACAMRLKLYCNRYGHFKDALVCSVNCVYRTRCNDFALFYDDNRAEVDALVSDYYEARREQKGPGRYDAYSGAQDNIAPAPVARPEELRKL